jgi:hypothetical protein
MTQHELEALAEAVLEGTASESERERLEGLIEKDPKARAAWESVRSAYETLADAELDDPPPGLRDSIERAVAHEREHRAGADNPGIVAWLRLVGQILTQRPAFRFGYAFAAGLAVGVLGLGAFLGSSRGLGSSTNATLAPVPSASEIVSIDGARLHVFIARNAGVAEVRLDADATIPAEAFLEWDPAQTRIDSIRWPESPVNDAALASGHLSLAIDHNTSSTIRFVPVSEEAHLRVTVQSGGRSADHVFLLPR